MSYNIDGFNERMNYINNSNDLNKIKNNQQTFDNSFAKMRVDERRNLVKTANRDNISVIQDVRGKKENFIIRNNNILNAKPTNSSQVSMQRNLFKK